MYPNMILRSNEVIGFSEVEPPKSLGEAQGSRKDSIRNAGRNPSCNIRLTS